MNVGIGITTTPNREARLKECLLNIRKHTKFANLYVHNDLNYRGVAFSKNTCLHHLRNCNYIFLFDDDCFPIHNDWLDYMIDAIDYTGEHHFLYLNESHKPIYKDTHIGVKSYKECGGVFMAMTGLALSTVGYMDKDYKGWGFEHAGWSYRVYKHGLNSAPYLMPNKLPDYLFAHDYTSNIESSLTDKQKQSNYQHNLKVFSKEVNEHPYYKPFEL